MKMIALPLLAVCCQLYAVLGSPIAEPEAEAEANEDMAAMPYNQVGSSEPQPFQTGGPMSQYVREVGSPTPPISPAQGETNYMPMSMSSGYGGGYATYSMNYLPWGGRRLGGRSNCRMVCSLRTSTRPNYQACQNSCRKPCGTNTNVMCPSRSQPKPCYNCPPGYFLDNSGYGGSGYNPGYDTNNGGSGYNPGYDTSNGGSGYNPGNNGGSGYNPGYDTNNGGSGYNPGYDTNNGGSGYNPGYVTGNGGSGYNPGYYTNGGYGYPGYYGNGGYMGYNPALTVNMGGGCGSTGGTCGGSGMGYQPAATLPAQLGQWADDSEVPCVGSRCPSKMANTVPAADDSSE